jgi:hypothetical protein
MSSLTVCHAGDELAKRAYENVVKPGNYLLVEEGREYAHDLFTCPELVSVKMGQEILSVTGFRSSINAPGIYVPEKIFKARLIRGATTGFNSYISKEKDFRNGEDVKKLCRVWASNKNIYISKRNKKGLFASMGTIDIKNEDEGFEIKKIDHLWEETTFQKHKIWMKAVELNPFFNQFDLADNGVSLFEYNYRQEYPSKKRPQDFISKRLSCTYMKVKLKGSNESDADAFSNW